MWLVLSVAMALATLGAQHRTTTSLVIVVDGLRPDFVTPNVMPRLVRLGQRGVVFTAHHSVFPTVTRVNASSFVTGAYPETHGLLGNTIYIPSVNATRGLDTSERKNLEAVARAEGRLLTAPTLGEILQHAGKKMLVVSSGSTGSSFLLNPMVAGGGIIQTEYTLPPALAPVVAQTLGPIPPEAVPNNARNQRAIDAYLKIGLAQLHPDVTFMWLSDPDETAHAQGLGSPVTRRALSLVDAGIGRVEDTLQARGLLEHTNILVTSDHGFSTLTGTLKLQPVIDPFVRKLDDRSPDIVDADGAIHMRGESDPARVARIVAALQVRPEVGAIFTRPGARGGAEGTVAGTLSFETVHWNHPRSADILVSANWNHEPNQARVRGKTTQVGVAGHGSSSPYDIHNTLIAAGPGFREHATSDLPTGNVDIAPTLLRLLGIPAPQAMTGRVIEEALRTAPPPSPKVDHVMETVSTRNGSYTLTAHFSVVAGRRYLDFTEVRRQ